MRVTPKHTTLILLNADPIKSARILCIQCINLLTYKPVSRIRGTQDSIYQVIDNMTAKMKKLQRKLGLDKHTTYSEHALDDTISDQYRVVLLSKFIAHLKTSYVSAACAE